MTTSLQQWKSQRSLIHGCILILGMTTMSTYAQESDVGVSPWGPTDEIGRLNLMSPESRSAIVSRIDPSVTYDLSVEYYVGMPSFQALGDPAYQFWMTHTPNGTIVDNPNGEGREVNERVTYSGAAVSMYTHMGTHIDTLNHFGLNGKIWNGYSAQEYLGDRGWRVTGAEKIPPIVARGVLIDVPAAKGLEMLGDNYRVTRQDLIDALDRQQVELEEGDVVLVRTGRLRLYEDAAAYMANTTGLGLDAGRYLVDEGGAMVVGLDTLGEASPSDVQGNYVPVHTYLLAQRGAPILELVYMEDLSDEGIYEFAFVGGSLKLRGADAAPMRPIAFRLR